MSDLNLSMSESLMELGKLIQLMDEDAENLSSTQAISDYIVPILESVVGEIEANRQYILQTADRTNLAYLMNEKTFTGEILTSIADHFSTVLEELPQDVDPDSSLGVALGEIQDLLATWMSFEISDEDEDEDGDEDDEYEDNDGVASEDFDEDSESVDSSVESSSDILEEDTFEDEAVSDEDVEVLDVEVIVEDI
jgi:hypothetical protein